MAAASSIVVKTAFADDIRRHTLSSPGTYQSLLSSLQAIYGHNNFVVKYEDEEKEEIVVSSDQEIEEAVRVFNKQSKQLRFKIEKVVQAGNSGPKPLEPATSKPAPDEPVPLKTAPDVEPDYLAHPNEIKNLLKALMADQKTAELVLNCIRDVIPGFMSQQPLDKVITDAVSKYPALANTPAVSKFLPKLNTFLKNNQKVIDQARCSSQSLVTSLLELFSSSNESGVLGILAAVVSGNGSTSTTPSTEIHDGVTCDGCHAKPIKGNRYKCIVCPNYDLCVSCMSADKHKVHPFMKVRAPVPTLLKRHSADSKAPEVSKVVPTNPVVSPPFLYQDQLNTLKAMGLGSDDLNRYLLLSKNGDIQACIDWILSTAPKS